MSRLRTLSLPTLLWLFVGRLSFGHSPKVPFWRAVGIVLGWAGQVCFYSICC